MEIIVFAGRLKNKLELLESSSGGAFTAISDAFLKNGDAVVCSIYNYDTSQPEFCIIHDEEKRNQARGSKYMQSKPGEIFKEAIIWLQNNQNKKLLFVGMGCQVDGFRKYVEMKGFRERVVLVDIICHGSSSPKLWREYAKTIGKIQYLTFKDKRNSWINPTALAIVNNEEIILSEYIKVFYNQCTLRPSCYQCPYATILRKTDITIGDYWGIERVMPNFFSPDGNSLFLIHTEKGMDLWNSIENDLVYERSSVGDCLQPSLVKPTKRSRYRKYFWKAYRKYGAAYVVKKYGDPSYQMGLKSKVKALIKRNN